MWGRISIFILFVFLVESVWALPKFVNTHVSKKLNCLTQKRIPLAKANIHIDPKILAVDSRYVEVLERLAAHYDSAVQGGWDSSKRLNVKFMPKKSWSARSRQTGCLPFKKGKTTKTSKTILVSPECISHSPKGPFLYFGTFMHEFYHLHGHKHDHDFNRHVGHTKCLASNYSRNGGHEDDAEAFQAAIFAPELLTSGACKRALNLFQSKVLKPGYRACNISSQGSQRPITKVPYSGWRWLRMPWSQSRRPSHQITEGQHLENLRKYHGGYAQPAYQGTPAQRNANVRGPDPDWRTRYLQPGSAQ